MFIWSVWNSKTDLAHGPRTILGYVGKRGWGVEEYWCLRKWVQWSPSIGGAKCDWLRRTKETCSASCVCISSLRGRCRAIVPGVLVYVHIYILYVCAHTCVCVYMCGHVYMYIYACVCVYVYVCIYVHVYVYVYVYAYLCTDCGSRYQCFSVWTVSCIRTCICVHMYTYACVCRYICMCILFAVTVACTLEQVCWALVHGQVCTSHSCVFTPTYTSANTLAAGCAHMCIFIYVCICMHIHMDAYVRLWYCLTRWGVVARIFYLCIRCICMRMYMCVHVCVFSACVYVCMES